MTTIHRGTDGRLLRSQAIRIYPWATVGLGKTLEAGILAYPGKGAWHERLMGLGLMTSREDAEPVCTIAGLVLFGRAPRRYLRRAGVRWMSFLGDDMSYQAQDDTVIDGPLVALRKGRQLAPHGGARADRAPAGSHASLHLCLLRADG